MTWSAKLIGLRCAHELGHLGGSLAAEQRAVVRLEERRQLLVAVLVVADRNACNTRNPELGVLPDLEERDVPTPGVAADDGALGVRDPAVDEVPEPGVHVLELGAADVSDQRVPPLAAVPDRAAVVDHADREPGVDVRLHLGLPAVEVEPRRAAVDEHQHWERAAGVVRSHVEAVHPLAVRVLEVPGLVRPAGRGGALLGSDELCAGVVEDQPLAVALLVREPDASVRTDACAPHEARLDLDRLERAAREVVAIEAGPSFDDVMEEERGCVRPPVDDVHGALEARRQIGALARGRVPDPGSLVTLELVLEREPLVPRDGRPALPVHRHALVAQFADRRARARIDDAQRRVDQVAVLGVLEAEERAVRRERAAQAAVLGGGEVHRLLRAMDLARWASVERYVDREPVAVADPDRDDPRALGQAAVPAVGNALEEGLRLTAVERLDEPAAGFVPGLVLEPQHTLAVERRGSGEDADRMIRHLAPLPGREVPCVHLPDARLVGRVHEPVGSGWRPLGQEGHRRAEALLPGLHRIPWRPRRRRLTPTVA